MKRSLRGDTLGWALAIFQVLLIASGPSAWGESPRTTASTAEAGNTIASPTPATFSADVGQLISYSDDIQLVGYSDICQTEPFDCDERYECFDEQEESTLGFFGDLQKNLDVYGQIRVRQGTDFERIGRPTRNRQRLRMRLGANYRMNPEVLVGARMTTGDRKTSLGPGDRAGAPLSYQNLGDGFDKFEFNLDRVFFEINPHWAPHSTLWLGKFQMPLRFNPIFAGPVGDLVWDEAAQAEGVAVAHQWDHLAGFDTVRVAGGISPVLELGNNDDASLYYTQVWMTKAIFADLQVAGGVSYFHWGNLNPDNNTTLSSQNNFGNAVISIGPNPEDVLFASKFHIINPVLAITLGGEDRPNARHPLQLVWETFVNTGSFDSDRDYGYSVGLAYGPAIKSRKQRDWQIYYTWNRVEQESVFTPVGQDDFQRSTNFRGQMFGMQLFAWDNIPLRLAFLSDTPILPINNSTETEWRGRIDITANW